MFFYRNTKEWRNNLGFQIFGMIMIRLSLGLWRNVTRRKGEYGGLLKQSNGSHGGTVGAWSDGACLLIPLALYT